MKHPLLARWAAMKLRNLARDARVHPEVAEFLVRGADLIGRDHTQEEIDALCDEFQKKENESERY